MTPAPTPSPLPGPASNSRLMVLLFTDAVGSTDLKSRLGNQDYLSHIARHDEIFRAIIADTPAATIYKDMGDGFLAGFERASDAVTAALRFQRALREEPWGPEPVRVRAGIHLGQVAQGALEDSGKPKLVGLAADVTARIMGLGLPGQILLTRAIFDDARQFLRRHPPAEPTSASLSADPGVRWMAHGLYKFKGADEPMEIYEVGAEPGAPLSPPPSGEKATRLVSADEVLLGWRPAVGIEIPRRAGWLLERKLGEGGVGEAWLAFNKTTRDRRVYKFCFEAARADALRREAKLFRVLRDALGSRVDIAKLHDVQFQSPPYFIESEYAELGSLDDWARTKLASGGLTGLPLAQRMEMAMRLAEAAAAAHSVGILHKDIKPANVLLFTAEGGEPRPRLADFGVGAVHDMSKLVERKVDVGGATMAALAAPHSSSSNAPIYAAPEVLTGRASDARADVYALGVITFQLAVGDLSRPLVPGWDKMVPDPLLRETIALAVDPDENTRLADASQLASRLRVYLNGSEQPSLAPQREPSGPASPAAAGHESTPVPQVAAVAVAPNRVEAGDIPTDQVFKRATVAGVPERIGSFRVLRKIASGGFGIVLEATRDDSFQRRVAIKLLQRGAVSEETLKRFERERQVMAAMNHPNIARLLEGGKTDDGRPWFAMEYVEGLPIDEYCDRNGLTVEERVAMFVKVCSALHTVHKAQVVHRDLKPSNILVNTKGEPKLLDFGIAKMTEPEWGNSPVVTMERRGPLTPQYASPEQVRGEPITTSSDVYSLGVVMFEILSGAMPYRIKNSGDHELEAKVCIAQHPKPSVMALSEPGDAVHDPAAPTATSAPLPGERSSEVASSPGFATLDRTRATRTRTTRAGYGPQAVERANRRSTTPGDLRRGLEDDLDAIVMMALRKEPLRRYESAMEMGDDLKRHIERVPVKARPETISYVATRFVGRHRGAVASVAVISLLVLVGLVVTSLSLAKAQREEKAARASRTQTLAMLGNLTKTFAELRRERDGAGGTKALFEAAKPIIESIKQIDPADTELRTKAADALEWIGEAAGSNGWGSLGIAAEANGVYAAAVEVREALSARNPNDVPLKAASVRTLNFAAKNLRANRTPSTATQAAELEAKALATARGAVRLDPKNREASMQLAIALTASAASLQAGAKIEMLKESLSIRESNAAIYSEAAVWDAVYNGRLALGEVLTRPDALDAAAALTYYKSALEAAEKRRALEPTAWEATMALMRANLKLGTALLATGDADNEKKGRACHAAAVKLAGELENTFAGRIPPRVRQGVVQTYFVAESDFEPAWRALSSIPADTETDRQQLYNIARQYLLASTEASNSIYERTVLLTRAGDLAASLSAGGRQLTENESRLVSSINEQLKALKAGKDE